MRINFILEIIGQPPEHIQRNLNLVLEQIDDNEDIEVISSDLNDPEETEDGLHAVFADVDARVDDITTVGHIANNYNPASIELVEPGEITVDRGSFNDLFADTLAKLHINNTQIKKLKNVKEHMTKNINALIRNAVLLSLEQGDKDIDDLADDVGVEVDDLEELLDAMEDENRLRSDGDTYSVRA